MKALITIPLFLVCLFSSSGQEDLQKFEFLIGNWQGVETGVAGEGIGFRSYTYELANNYLFVNNQSTFPKSAKKTMGEVHRDVGIFSYNQTTSKIIFRQFHIEGFTNIYELDTAASTDSSFVFITREIENNPGNWKAKLRLERLNENQFKEYFYIATEGENYSLFLSNQWTRVN